MQVGHHILDPNLRDLSTKRLCALAVMTKAPHAGKVKTRLVPPLTPDEAAQLNKFFLHDTAAAIAAAVVEGGRGIAVYTPVGAEEAYINILPADFQLVPQRGDGFGERLSCAMEDLFRVGFASVCLIDSDSPTVSAEIYSRAVELLSNEGDRVVLGPSDDGGYYLIGLKKNHRRVFEEIDWSTERVLEQTIQRARGLNLAVEFLPACYDVDDRATLTRLCNELLSGNAGDRVAPESQRFLRKLIEREGRDRIWPNE